MTISLSVTDGRFSSDYKQERNVIMNTILIKQMVATILIIKKKKTKM